MNEAVPVPARLRRWWVALILNLLLTPAGYAYVGDWAKVLAVSIVFVTAGAFLSQWTLNAPPGVYAFGQNGVAFGRLAIGVLLGLHAALIARRAPPKAGSRWRHALLYLAPWMVVFATGWLFREYGLHPTYVMSSASMEPTLKEGDIVMVSGARATCNRGAPNPGQVVVFRRPGDPAAYMHRVVAGPGQTVALHAGQLSIDGKAVNRRALGSKPVTGLPGARAAQFEETLPNGATYRVQALATDGGPDEIAPTTVPAGSWYLLGDNRDNAADSRVRGPVVARDICAIALKVVFAKEKSRVGQQL